ncbi:hypothetical protein P22_1020 [Propionispora sp. 2/2-37]|uniref:sugar-binding transcriptional regulator n=1 Tax=Propionispora sp. 2/2-37 TaxID=1677858 RepID=UPI0006BB63CB|nr:sugar-binding transcriptional regulator [Propionispora sp. 2/2-37]CUH94951.1 hypothetical protein P22_1020 [Propionispora sp. 2/2-37]
MDEWEKERLSVKIASMYYIQNLTQDEISKKLGIHRTTISRLIKSARQEGIITISIREDLNKYYELESRLESVFGLKEAYVVSSQRVKEGGSEKQALGKVCADLLTQIVQDGDVVGLSWGSSLKEVANALKPSHQQKTLQADIVAICGGPGNVESENHVNSIVGKVSQALKARPNYFYAPIITSKKETKEAILQDDNCIAVTNLWKKVRIAVVGIGSFPEHSSILPSGYITPQEIEMLRQLKVVGDICSRFYTIDGSPIHIELTERTISIDMEYLKHMDYSIAVAGAPQKVPAILGALKGKFVNVLITTEETAQSLLDVAEKSK